MNSTRVKAYFFLAVPGVAFATLIVVVSGWEMMLQVLAAFTFVFVLGGSFLYGMSQLEKAKKEERRKKAITQAEYRRQHGYPDPF